MSSSPDQLLERVDHAMSMQSWREAWALLEQINPDYQGNDIHLGARRQDFIMRAAHCLRHQGNFGQAEEFYQLLLTELQLNDPRLAEALLGQAEIIHNRDQFAEALQILRSAAYVPGQSQQQKIRVATTTAHVMSHLHIDKSLAAFAATISDIPSESDMLDANLHFWYGDALLVAGQYQQSEQQLQDAKQLALQAGCAVTLADCLRRLALVKALQGDTRSSISDLQDLVQSDNLYKIAGDRGHLYLHLEHGELLRSLGKTREAESEFQRGLWAARSLNDFDQQGHCQLGLFELSRAILRPNQLLLKEAKRHYSKADCDWGELHVMISDALTDRARRAQIVSEALLFAEQSDFSSFEHEIALLKWINSANEEDLGREPHLMNYP
jgi:tetratricopeptide (TPR) repeat protein